MNKTNQISLDKAISLLNKLIGKEIVISCGYGGVIFIEIGNIINHRYEYEEGKEIIRKYGDYRLFCDENWTFTDNKKTHIDRWTSSSSEIDDLFETIGVCKLKNIEVIGNFKKTIFHISGGYKFTIVRDDSIDTFSLTMIPEKKKLTVFGNGDIELNDYEEDQWYLKNRKPRPRQSKTIAISKDFLRKQMPDLLQLSIKKAQEFIQPIFGQKIQTIEINSGTRFTLQLGADCRKMLSEKDRKSWLQPIYQWSLTIDELWILEKDEKAILDVQEKRFHFEEDLVLALKNKQVLKIHLDKNGTKIEIEFSDGYTLKVLESNRYSKWDLNDFLTGISIGSYRDEGLIYRISSPIHLSNKYKTDDVHLDAILYELEFYRNYFA